MLKKRIFLLVLPALFLLTSCGAARSKECKKIAETYLTQIEGIYSDTLSLTEKEPEQYGEMYTFFVQSEKYQDEFRVNVNANNALTDTYFSLALAENAQTECTAAVDSALPAFEGTVSAQPIRQIASSSLSAKLFQNIQEAQHACPAVNLLNVSLSPKGDTLSKDDLSVILCTLKDHELYATVTVAGDETVYEVSEDGLYMIEQGTADGGAMMARREFDVNS